MQAIALPTMETRVTSRGARDPQERPSVLRRGSRRVEGAALEILWVASEGLVPRELIPRLAVEKTADDLRRELSIEPQGSAQVEPCFEEFLRERMARK